MNLYTPGRWSQGTPEALAEIRAAARAVWVWRLRHLGERLPAGELAVPVQGLLLALNHYGETDRFVAKLFPDDTLANSTSEMHGARVLREAKDGSVTITGDEFDWQLMVHHRQTWLCAPTLERGLEILAKVPT